MSIKLGTADVKFALGSAEVSKLYKGTEEVYSAEEPLTELCFTAVTAGATVGMDLYSSSTNLPTTYYSRDRITWTQYTTRYNNPTMLTLTNIGDKIYFKANAFGDSQRWRKFVMTGKIAASGNVMSMCYPETFNSETTVNGYFKMLFSNCTSLTTAPVLPATSVKKNECYLNMFSGCTSLVIAPEIPITSVGSYTSVFYGMFSGCTSLTTPPPVLLPQLTSSNYGTYGSMFKGCTSLITPPAIMTELIPSNQGCSEMFSGCSSLTSVPIIRTKSFGNNVTTNMFSGCTSLQVSDTQTAEAPYEWKIPFSGVVSSSQTATDMFTGCAGTRSSDSLSISSNSSKTYYTQNRPIPSSESIPLYFTALENNSTVGYVVTGTVNTSGIKVSTDEINWTTWDGTAITLANVGDKIYVKNTNNTLSSSTSNYFNFIMSGKIKASGNIMSMKNYDALSTYCFCYLFKNCAGLVVPPQLSSGTLTDYCYNYMFSGCTSLTTLPELPATALASYCYSYMFKGCTSLTTLPSNLLPATVLSSYCYLNMFSGCTSLTTPPELPATTLTQSCYQNMFRGCTGLTTLPSNLLPATTLTDYCYSFMFYGCTSLATPPELPATTLANGCYNGMFMGCSSLYVSSSRAGQAQKTWRIPQANTFTNTYAQTGMFTNCLGTRSSDNMAGASGKSYTYYTQNQPI